MLKSIACGDLRKSHGGTNATLAGWVHRRRDHGGLIFIDLRDSKGIVQVVFNPGLSQDAHRVAEAFRQEWVVLVEGKVGLRPPGTENPHLATGEIEVYAARAEALNPSKTPPKIDCQMFVVGNLPAQDSPECHGNEQHRKPEAEQDSDSNDI